jgi:maltokinase
VDSLDLAPSLRLAVYEDDRGHTFPVPLLVGSGSVRRARAGDGASSALVDLLAGGSRTVRGFEVTSWLHSPVSGERAITVDQTNESVVVGDRAVVKWTVLADEGPHPAPPLLAMLESNGFDGMPRPWGAVQWRPADGSAPRLLALVVDFLPGAVDGWTWLVDDLREASRTRREARVRAAGTAVGELVADFHLALAASVRRSTVEEVDALRASTHADLARALAVSSGTALAVLSEHLDGVRAAFDGMPTDATPVMRVHGDLHIGQVLRVGSTYALTDFDGNPVVPAGSRLREEPAAADVTGMAQSFTHAGHVVCKHNPELPADEVHRMAAAGRSAFLRTYRDRLGDRSALLDERLLHPLSLRQVCREFTYAATHLPRWSYVPEATLPMLVTAP